MRLLKAQNTNVRNIKGRGIKYDVNNQVSFEQSTSIIIPKVSAAEKPKHPNSGEMIYNKDTAKFEVYENGAWQGYVDVADNVYYVSKNGSDANNGKTVGSAFASLGYAVTQVPEGSTIKVKSGDYTINNPIRVPRNVAIVGDSLRTVTVRAGNPTQDMFWVTNGSYLEQMTFKDHEAPAAAVAFPPDGSAGEIFRSPYVQNCTSITTTGTGMRVDGAHAQGLKSMVVDAFTQYNQGGIGIHMLNLGNTQLVSVFTICCDIAILCENGGFCSLTNSNSSFGNFGLKADGVSPPKYYGSVAQIVTNPTFGGSSVLINNLSKRPNSGDAVAFDLGDETTTYYTISSASDLKIGKTRVDEPLIENEDPALLSARTTVFDNIDIIKKNTIDYINTMYPTFDYNQSKCARDVELIIRATVDDMVLNTNYKTVVAGRSYYQNVASTVIDDQLTETLDGITYARDSVLNLLTNPSTEYTRVQANFNEIIDIITNGVVNADAFVFNPPTNIESARTRAVTIIQANRTFVEEEAIAFVSLNYPDLTYDELLCRRDIQYIIDAIIYDTLYSGNSQSLYAAQQYYINGVLQLGAEEKTATLETYKYIRQVLGNILLNISVVRLNSVVTQDSSNTSTTVAIADSVRNKIDIVSAYIEDGNYVNDFVEVESANFEVQDRDAQAIRNTILSLKSKLEVDTIDFLNEKYSEFIYNKEKCSRDVGLMLDAVAMDIALGTNYNSIIAGLSYQRANANLVKSNQGVQTRAAIEFVSSEVDNLDISTTAKSRATALFAEILNIFDNQTPSAIDYEEPSNASTEDINAKDLLQSNKDFIVAETIAHINETYLGFIYNKDKCSRDVGLIVEAIALDNVLGTNYNSITAGLAYRRANASTVLTDQLSQTVSAIAHIKQVLKSFDFIDQTALTLALLVDEIVNIIETGSPSSINYNAPINATEDQIDAANLLQTNKTFLQNEIITWIDLQITEENPPFTSSFSYNSSACSRDVGLIVDALTFDILYGGNSATIIAADSYFVGTTSQLGSGEQEETIAAYEQLKILIAQILTGQSAESTRTGELIQIIINVIDDGSVENLPARILPNFSWSAATIRSEYVKLIDAKASIQSQIIDYIDTEIADFSYNETKCARDVGYIVDALTYDQLYGGNSASRTVALSYYVGTENQLGSNEIVETIGAYEYLSTVLQDIIQGNTVTPTVGNIETQVITANVATATEALKLKQNLDYIIDVLKYGNTDRIVRERLPNISWVGTELQSSYLEIKTNRSIIQNDTIDFIDTRFGRFNFNQTKCSRDVGLILEAVTSDLVLGTNYRSVLAGSSYYRASAAKVINEQLSETVAALEFLKNKTLELITTDSTLQEPEYSVLSNNFDIVIDIIENGESEIPLLAYNSPNSVDNNKERARDILQANRDFLIEEGIEYISNVYPSLVYDNAKCREDIGYIVDAITYDMIYDGNSQTTNAAGEYYSGGILRIPSDERAPTIDTYKRLKDIASDCVTNTVVSNLQTVETQDTSLPAATATESQKVSDLFDIVIRILEKGYISEVTFDESIDREIISGTAISFHQYSLITASGHTFEWVGAGTNVNSALPYEGGRPLVDQQVIETNGGRVYYTSTDQEGDFRIGGELTINRTNGTIEGTTFDRSLFAVLTPYILAIED
jgi:hypothetical protein